MLKESILFVAATGVLVYFITPSEKPPEAERLEKTEPIKATSSVQNSNDGWDSDSSGDDGWGDEAEDENFVFGEPMTVPDGENGDRDKAKNSSRSQHSAKNAGSGEPGSIYNPIVVKPKTLPSTEDY